MNVAEFTFDPEVHEYRVDNRVLPSVTTIVDSGGLWPFGKADEDPSFYMERGRNVHLACELHDRGELDETTLDETTGPRLESWKKFRRESNAQIIANECPLYHRTMGYAGTMDRVIQWGALIGILDLKCGQPDPAYGIQTAGYEMLVEQPIVMKALDLKGKGIVELHRWSLHLLASGRYEICDYTDRTDRATFKHCLGVHYWKRRHR